MTPTSERPRQPGPRVEGFTVVELLVVVVIGAILAGIVGPQIGRAQARMDTEAARDAFILYAARARSAAIERGSITMLVVNTMTDQVTIRSGATVLDTYDFAARHEVDVQGTSFTVCYSSRGLAQSSCSTIVGDTNVIFTRSGQRAVATMKTLGQVQRGG